MAQSSSSQPLELRPRGATDYESIVAASADLITVSSIDGRIRYVSPASHRLFGWDPSELEGRDEVDFVHPDDVASFLASRAATADHAATMRFRFLCRDG